MINFTNATSDKKRYATVFCVEFVLLLVMTFSVKDKQMGHVDEFYTYSLANSGFMGRNHPEIFEKSLHWYAYDTMVNSLTKKFDNDALLKDLTKSGIIHNNENNPFKNDFEHYAYDVMRLNYESAASNARHIIWDVPLVFFMFDGGKTSLTSNDIKNIMMPNDEAKFNFASVFWNQSFDVHPPLYYMAINTVCSIFYNNGEFSPWHGLGINLFFFFLTLPLMYYITYFISKGNHGLSMFTMVMYALMAGGIVAFLRMYMMLTFFTALYTALILPYFKGETSIFSKICLALSIILGSLTHHYFLVYLGITGILLFIYLIYTRKIKHSLDFMGISAFSVIISILIFPFTLIHMFFSEHGAVDILYKLSNMNGIEEYAGYIAQYFLFIFETIFGDASLLPIIFLVFGFALICVRKINFPAEIRFLFVTLVLYVTFVAITTKYQDERYITNIYPIAVIMFVSFLHGLYKAFAFNINLKPALALILLIFTLFNFNSNVSKYLYPDAVKRYSILEKYKNYPCVYIYDSKDRSFSSQIDSLKLIKELGLYSQVDFVEFRDLNKFLADYKEKSAIIYFNNIKNMQNAESYFLGNLITEEYGYKVYEIKN